MHGGGFKFWPFFVWGGKTLAVLYKRVTTLSICDKILAILTTFWSFLMRGSNFWPFFIEGQILDIFVWGGQNGKKMYVWRSRKMPFFNLKISKIPFFIGRSQKCHLLYRGSRKCHFLYRATRICDFCMGTGLENAILF